MGGIGRKGCRGVTLLELLTVVALIAVMSAMAAPLIIGQLPKLRLNIATREIGRQMNLTRLKAISTNKEHRLVFTVNDYPVPDSYRIEKKTGGAWEIVRPELVLPGDANIYNVTFPLSRCEFNSNGTSSSGGVYLKLCDSVERFCKLTTTSSLGKINVALNY